MSKCCKANSIPHNHVLVTKATLDLTLTGHTEGFTEGTYFILIRLKPCNELERFTVYMTTHHQLLFWASVHLIIMTSCFSLFAALSDSCLWDLIADDGSTNLISKALLDSDLLRHKDFWEIRIQATEIERFRALVFCIDLAVLEQRDFKCDCSETSVFNVVVNALFFAITDSHARTYCSQLRIYFFLQWLLVYGKKQELNLPVSREIPNACVLSGLLDNSSGALPTGPCDVTPPGPTFTTLRGSLATATGRDAALFDSGHQKPEVARQCETRQVFKARVNICEKYETYSQLLPRGGSARRDYIGALECCDADQPLSSSSLLSISNNKREEFFSSTNDDFDMEIADGLRGINQTLSLNPSCMESKLDSKTATFKQRVTVRDGEINEVFERSERLKSLSCLDKLRDFTSSNLDENQQDLEACCDVTNGDSDGGFVSHDDADIVSLSSFASASSFSSEILNGWLNEEEFDSRQDSLLENVEMDQRDEIVTCKAEKKDSTDVKQTSAQSTCDERCVNKEIEYNVGLQNKMANSSSLTPVNICREDSLLENVKMEQSDEIESDKVVKKDSNDVNQRPTPSIPLKRTNDNKVMECKAGLQSRAANSTLFPTVNTGTVCKTQRDVFWSMEHELKSTVDFKKVLPDLIKFNIFSAEHRTRYGNFKGKFSSMVLQAVGERIDVDESALGPFLLALRPHYPAIVDKIHQRVFCEVHSKRPKAGAGQNEKIDTGNGGFYETRRFPKHQRRYNIDHQGSPYARRQFTVGSARDHDHVTDLQRNYLPHPPTSRYFSKDTSKHSIIPENFIQSPTVNPTLATQTAQIHHHVHTPNNYKEKVLTTSVVKLKSTPTSKVANGLNKTSAPKNGETLVIGNEPQNQMMVANHNVAPVVIEPVCTENQTDQEKKPVAKDNQTNVPEAELEDTKNQQQLFPDQTSIQETPDVAECSANSGQDRKGATNEDTKLNLPPAKRINPVKRASSFQEHRTRHGAIREDKTTPDSKTKRSDLLKNYFNSKDDGKIRTRSVSFSLHPEKNHKTNSSTTNKTLQSRFESLNVDSQAAETDQNDPDASLAELVKRCVVSARSGWLIRRFPNVSERRNKLLTLLANLPERDVAEIKDSCPITVKFVKHNCGVGKSAKTEEGKESPQSNDNSDFIMTSSTEPKIESTSSPQIRGQRHETGLDNMDGGEEKVTNTTTTTTDLSDADQLSGVNSDFNRKIANDIEREEARRAEENERNKIRVCAVEAFSLGAELKERTCPPTESFSNVSCTQENITVATEQQSTASQVQKNSENVFEEPIKKICTGDNKQVLKSAKSGEKLKKRGGTFVSHALFPISKRKNAEIRKKLEVGKLAVPVKVAETPTTAKQEDAEESSDNSVDNIHNEMPPVLSVNPSQKIDFFNGHCTEQILFNERSTSPLVTILTNGGNVSPPSSKKKGARVSFSQLPPVEIELEPQDSEWDSKSNIHSTDVTSLVTDSVVTLTVKSEPVVQDQSTMKPVIVAKKTKKKPVNHSVNEIDQINELLMDILEEIEAENISLNQCLDNLVRDGLMAENVATTVSSTFVEFQTRSSSPTAKDEFQSDLEKERGVEKLLDVLTNLGLEKLQRCRNCVLGRLCQLARYEDFENAQKAAAAASDSSPELSASRKTYERANAMSFPAEKSPLRVLTTGRVPSSEDSELSATESDDDFYSLRHQIGRQRHDVSTNPTIEEEEDGECPTESERKLDLNHNVQRETFDIKTAMPVLIDNCVIAPRHAWLILGAGGEKEQKAKLKQFLRRADNAKLESLYCTPQFGWIKSLMEDNKIEEAVSKPRLSFLKARERFQKPTSKLQRSSSLRASDLHGGHAPNFSDVAHLVEEHAAAREEQEKRLSPPLDAILKRRGGGLRRTQSVNVRSTRGETTRETENMNRENAGTLDSWCRSQQLSQQTAIALSQSGYQHIDDLPGITESEIEQLSGLGWIDKAKLWVAIENMRLEEFYHKTHSGLADIMKILEK